MSGTNPISKPDDATTPVPATDATTPVPATATPVRATATHRPNDTADPAPAPTTGGDAPRPTESLGAARQPRVVAVAADRGGFDRAASDEAVPAEDRGPRTGTLVGALVLILLGVGVVAVGLGVRLDLQAALIALLVIAGAALLVGALLSARRRR